MQRTSPRLPFRLSGKWSHRLMSLQALYHATLFVALRRLARGPRLPNWSWSFETAIRFLQLQTARAFDMADPAEGRAYESSLVFHSPAVAKVEIEPVAEGRHLDRKHAGAFDRRLQILLRRDVPGVVVELAHVGGDGNKRLHWWVPASDSGQTMLIK